MVAIEDEQAVKENDDDEFLSDYPDQLAAMRALCAAEGATYVDFAGDGVD